MSANLAEWAVVWVFLLAVTGLTFAEAFWISRKGWSSFGKAFVFSALSNFIGISVGFFVVFIVLIIFMMLAFDGSLQKFPMGDAGMVLILILTALFTPVLLTVCKRVFLAVLKIQTGKLVWRYALASSVLILCVSLGAPSLIGYLLFR